jgi:hypothetical protein
MLLQYGVDLINFKVLFVISEEKRAQFCGIVNKSETIKHIYT